MARKRAFDERKVLDALKSVFWRNGYEGTSYADIMDATGLGKGSLYKAFGDKRDLYLKSLSDYIAIEAQEGINILAGEQISAGPVALPDGNDRIARLLSTVIEAVEINGDRRGCYLCNAAVDLAPIDKDVEAITVSALNAMREAFRLALDYISDPAERALKAENLLTSYFGMRVLAKAGVPVSDLKRAREAALSCLS